MSTTEKQSRKRILRVLLLTGMYPNSANPLNGAVVEAQRNALESLGVHTGIVHLRPKEKTEIWGSLLKLRRFVRYHQYDLIHVHYGLSALSLSLSQNLPIVVTFHGTDINGIPTRTQCHSIQAWILSAIARMNCQLSRAAKAIIVMSHEMKARLPEAVHTKTWVEPMGVDTSIFYQHPKQEARAELGWGEESVVVFCNNNSESIKRQDIAEKAIECARKRMPSLRLLILKGIARKKIPLILSAADCLLVTSDKEGSPNIVRESLACNLPIVSVPVGDLPNLLVKNPSAGILTTRAPGELAKSLCKVIENGRPKNLNRIIRGNTIYANAARVKKIYEHVLNIG